MSFHNESYSLHDFPKRGHDTILFAGDVIRVFDGPYGDGTILGFNDAGEAKVARPYAYASGVGTTGPRALLGHEDIVYTVGNLKHFVKQANETGAELVLSRGRTTR